MIRRRQIVVCLIALSVGGMALLAAPTPKPNVLEHRLVGEWSFKATREKENDSEVVWTIRENGSVRIDMVTARTGEKVRGPMVGRWTLDRGDLLVTWETWNEAHSRPVQVEERLRVRELEQANLTLRQIYAPPRDPAEGITLEFKRFAGWKAPE
jgi:hypothetical protein